MNPFLIAAISGATLSLLAAVSSMVFAYGAQRRRERRKSANFYHTGIGARNISNQDKASARFNETIPVLEHILADQEKRQERIILDPDYSK